MKYNRLICAILALFIFSNLLAEKAPIKYGKISNEEIEMTVYHKDSSAVAVILCDYKTVNIKYRQNQGFIQDISRNLRIKILKKEGYDWAKLEIDLRKNYDNLGVVKACTYNLVNGKIEKTKLRRSQMFNEDINKYWETTKFEMPAVQKGSLIDIEYSIQSKSFWIHDRYFQTEIPIKLSEYHVYIPEYFYYKQLEKGYLLISDKKTETKRTSINFTEKSRSVGKVTQTNFSSYNVDYDESQYTFILRDVPAFKTEDYITTKKNYLTCVQFELSSIRYPRHAFQNFTNTWPTIGEKLMLDSDFGGRIKGGGIIREEIKTLTSLNLTDEQKIASTVNLIRNKISWNGFKGIYSYSGNKAWKESEGSCADINLLLTAALKDLGLDAKPVILSTRNHGLIHPAQIILDQYNYVISSVKLGDKIILLDATDKNTDIGVLPKRCLNGKGRIIDEKGGNWTSLQPTQQFQKSYRTQFEFADNGVIKGKIIETHKGYAAISKRRALLNYNSDEEYIEKYQENLAFDITLDSITNKKDIKKPITLTYTFESENGFENMGDILLIDPMILAKNTENPFKLEKRDYPVDFSYPYNTVYMASITIPAGYTVDNLPKPKRIAMPNNNASFFYSIQNSGNSIIVVSKFNISKITFLPEEYLSLKEFYNQMIETQSEKIVLKKTS
ncbi:MAG: DUF3857 domain-containing protein [Salinivirgaceae bacterium]|jgi:hypothetical protein|nr:DUF3857 domain-containing protein [Salinivirgaceae bacterium]